MSCIHSKNTRPEVALGKLIWRKGIRYRKHYKIPGRPDFVVVSRKIAIFVDGDFWHGHNWKLRGFKDLNAELASYKKFWRNKIRNNIARDQRVNMNLRKYKWKVVRVWESDVKRDPDKVAKKIVKIYKSHRPAL
jgi:DNA mismatch endonuclease (patch repair protein)